MKLLSWAHRKLLPTTSHGKQQNYSDRGLEKSNGYLACCEANVEDRESRGTHAEVLSIGTLGLGNLLTSREEDEKKEEEEEEEKEGYKYVHPIAGSVSPNRESLSSNAASSSSQRASTCSNRVSISSNRESVSSIDIQRLQEELQRILYFKLGHEQQKVDKSNSPLELGSKARPKKQRKHAGVCTYVADGERKQLVSSAERKSHVPSRERGSLRGALPLRNFLEMPMDTLPTPSRPPSAKLLSKKQYLLLMQSLKSKFLHYTSPTRANFSVPSLFDKLSQPYFPRDLQHGSTLDKMAHLFRKLMNKRPLGQWRKGDKGLNYEEDEHIYPKEDAEEDDEEEETSKWAVTRSCRGSERFIKYITTTLAQSDKDRTSLIQQQHPLHHHYDSHPHFQGGNSLQLRLATSPPLDNEYWIKTDDEYLVLEL